MSRLIDADAIITALIYDEKHEETQEVKMSIADFLDSHTVEGCPQNGGWISVKDGLPENDNEVITAYKIDDEKAMKKRNGKLFVKTGNWTGYRWTSVWDEYKAYAIEEEVLYWMPLPEPPKTEK